MPRNLSPEEKKKDANPHKDHRVRVKARFDKEGLGAFAPHEVLELLLFYALPQKDTNELAHALLDQFQTLSGVFSASKEALCRVEGISEHTATLLRLILPASNYALATEGEKPVFKTADRIAAYLRTLYRGVREETVYLLLLDNASRLIDCRKVHVGSVNSASLTIPSLVGPAVGKQASAAVLAHNHPFGIAVPSQEDLDTTLHVRDAFEMVGIRFLEHFLVAGEDCVGLMMGTGSAAGRRRGGVPG